MHQPPVVVLWTLIASYSTMAVFRNIVMFENWCKMWLKHILFYGDLGDEYIQKEFELVGRFNQARASSLVNDDGVLYPAPSDVQTIARLIDELRGDATCGQITPCTGFAEDVSMEVAEDDLRSLKRRLF